jgi:integrase
MVFLMARPTKRSGSSNGLFKKRVPSDVLPLARGKEIMFSLPEAPTCEKRLVVRATVGEHVAFSLRTADPALVNFRHAAALEQFERACGAFRRGPQRLTNRRHVELAGVLYDNLAYGFEEEPIDAAWWGTVAEVAQRVLAPPPAPSLVIETYPGAAQLAELERYIGPFLDPILSREGVIPTAEDRPKLLRGFARALIDAATKLKRNAEGDYTPDTAVAAKYPRREAVGTKAPSSSPPALTFDDLLARWEKERSPAPSSRVSFRQHVVDFKRHLGHSDPRRVAKADVISWKDALLEREQPKLSVRTINDGYLASIRTLYLLAMRNDLLAADPTQGVRVQFKLRAGESRLPYQDAEVAAILALADAETDPGLRWIPWLLALTGARVGEIAQLWGNRVTDGDTPIIRIAPSEDGGTIKNAGSERDVPLHPAIIERGFLEFVKTRPDGGPLFYGGRNATPRPRKSETSGHASDRAINSVREWIRANGFIDPRKAPSHAFRHWFKTKCADLDISDSLVDAIQGHRRQSAADVYRHFGLAKKTEAIRKISIPTLGAAAQTQPRERAKGS